MIITDMSQVGDVVRQRRTERGLSQSQLAELTGTTRQWVSRFEQGKNDVSVGRLLDVAEALDLTLDLRSPQRHLDGPRATSGAIDTTTRRAPRPDDGERLSAGVAAIAKTIVDLTNRRRAAAEKSEHDA
ncbi:helix-turn-helix protein [Labedella gwakjiensis]|uniref:Helix-turn-helix protein n=1 Tax=Labedella gwakjiensis TaxID=390269 RepID=A0A2P8GWF3_9MICO|nr:helix-turn-helix transcriptional regulator [Labedella gwakjiensis]PSL38300.1 helix-turn-helix protein [Labedella gwakjiensis]RUQ87164.1 XRE family transcriptional regulator [Labedella gwakjiensis]